MTNLFDRKRRMSAALWVLILIAGFAAGLGGVYLYLAPRVIAAHPADGQTVGRIAPVEITFSTAMDAACTQAHIHLSPALPGEFAWQGNMLQFLPKDPWPTGQAVTVTVSAGACSTRGIKSLTDARWTFRPGGQRIAYLTSEDGVSRILTVPAEGGTSTTLLESTVAIRDFAVSPRGDFLVYSTGPFDGPGNLWILRLDGAAPELLLDCGADACSSPAISPDGASVAYERTPMETGPSGASLPGKGRVEMLSLQDRAPTPASLSDDIANTPVWAPNGWLSYFDGTRQAIVVDDLKGGKTFIPNLTGESWSWFPDSTRLVFPELQASGIQSESENQTVSFTEHLILVQLDGNLRTDLTGANPVEESSPAVSPDGTRLAFSRNFLDHRWVPGLQLWVMTFADSKAAVLTNLPDYSQSSIHWSPDGSAMVFMRFHETRPADPPEIWRIDADGSHAVKIAAGGYLPQWLP